MTESRRPWRTFLATLKWPVTLAVFAGLLLVGYQVNAYVQRQRSQEANDNKASQPRNVGNGTVELKPKLAESYGLRDEPAQAVAWAERLPVYGRLVPNPRCSAEVRTPFAGTLRPAAGAAWPAPGSHVRAGQVLGLLEIRVGPQERLDLLSKLNEARVRQQGAEDIVKIQQERLARLKPSAKSEFVSQNEIDEAQVKLSEARTQVATAVATVKLWQATLAEIDRQGSRKDSTWNHPLTAPVDGEVAELAGRPGVVLEAGGLVARVTDFRRPLARLDFPPEALRAGPPPELELSAATGQAAAAPPLFAALLGAAPQVDAASQFPGYWYEADLASSVRTGPAPGEETAAFAEELRIAAGFWRPGLLVKAMVKVPDVKPRKAVAVPVTALLYHQGRTLLYVHVAPGKYERREVQVLGRDGDRWVLAGGVTAGEPVVARQAQVLLSEEFRTDVDND